MTQTVAYRDEYGVNAEGWNDLDDVTTVTTDTGTATDATFTNIILPPEHQQFAAQIKETHDKTASTHSAT